MRMLTGISETGTEHEDPISFSSELALGTNSPTIELRNDADPTQEPVMYAPPPSTSTPTSHLGRQLAVLPRNTLPRNTPPMHTRHTLHTAHDQSRR